MREAIEANALVPQFFEGLISISNYTSIVLYKGGPTYICEVLRHPLNLTQNK